MLNNNLFKSSKTIIVFSKKVGEYKFILLFIYAYISLKPNVKLVFFNIICTISLRLL